MNTHFFYLLIDILAIILSFSLKLNTLLSIDQERTKLKERAVWQIEDKFNAGYQGEKDKRVKDWQPQLLKLQNNRIINQVMNEYNLFIPTPLPSFFYLPFFNSNQQIEPLPAQTRSYIASEPVLRHLPTASSPLELSKDELLAAGYDRKKRVWSAEEDQRLLDLVGIKEIPWKDLPKHMPDRTEKMCYSRHRRLLAQARQRWSPQEEHRLKSLVEEKGQQWRQFSSQFPHRTWKQLRDKYTNYLRPDINKEDWNLEQDQKILELIGIHGTKWKSIQMQMPHRTDNQIKNRYYGRLKILLKKKAKRRSRQ